MDVGLIMGVLVPSLSLTSFFLPLDLNGFSDGEALPVPWIQKVHASLGSKGERQRLPLSLSLSLHLPAELQLVFFHRPFLRSQGLVFPRQAQSPREG